MDAIVLAVSHDEFKRLTISQIDNLFGKGKKILIDIKGIMNRKNYEEAGYLYWRL